MPSGDGGPYPARLDAKINDDTEHVEIHQVFSTMSPPRRPPLNVENPLQISLPETGAFPAASPMMSDLLLALQHSQSCKQEKDNLQRWIHPVRDDDDSEYHAPREEEVATERYLEHYPLPLSASNSTYQQRRRLVAHENSMISNPNSSQGPNEGLPLRTKPSPGLRASLDAGMATMGSWIRSHSTGSKKTLSSSHPLHLSPAQGNDLLLPQSVPVDHLSRSTPPSSATAVLHTHSVRHEENHVDSFAAEDAEGSQQRRLRSASEPELRDLLLVCTPNTLRQRKPSDRRRRALTSESRTGRNEAEDRLLDTAYRTNNSMIVPPLQRTAAATPHVTIFNENHFFQAGSSTRIAPREMSINVETLRSSSHLDRNTVSVDLPVQARSTYAYPDGSGPTLGGEPHGRENLNHEQRARARWIRINRRFQLVITVVAFLFSFLLFAILICWVALTSAYVLSFDKICDIPLKPYFWLVTLQLVLDVFRSDILRFVFRWDTRSNVRIPATVIAYNILYLIYAMLVLRLGIKSVVAYDETPMCRSTAPDLFKTSLAFVSLSIAAWTTVIFGYLLPFCLVAVLLTVNGYNPNAAASQNGGSAAQPVFPIAYATSGAPPGCVDQLRVVPMHDFPNSYPRECCICMEAFNRQNVVVETKCLHIFHKSCCREWLRQARTCPVCRDDIPSTLEGSRHGASLDHNVDNNSPRRTTIPIGPSGRPVAGFLHMLCRARHSINEAASNQSAAAASMASPSLDTRAPQDMEAGHATNHF